jgi:DNA-nicking Smr family endonuclease
MSWRRQLSDEEQALWSSFVHSITPLRHAKKAEQAAASDIEPAPKSAKAPDVRPQPQPSKTLPLAPLGRRMKQRVARGREAIDARIDLHGMTQAEAHAALLVFLQRAQGDGARMVLIVTGKGSGGSQRDSAATRGVLKRQVPLWLSLPEFRSFIVGFEDAHIGHGGEGALYVRLRRAR